MEIKGCEDEKEEEKDCKEESDSPKPLLQDAESAEKLSVDGAETGGEADQEHAAKTLSEQDVYHTSPSSHNDSEEAESAAHEPPTDTNLPSVDARLHPRELSAEEETQSLEELELLFQTLTADPGTGRQGEDITPELQTGCSLEGKETLMDAEQGSKDVTPTPSKEEGELKETPVAEVKEEENSSKMNGESDDKKNGGEETTKYKTVSYRKIRRGNTRQRIDEFEAMMNS
ncbi:moesin-like [Thunnus albacares]|uniref:moesin-like n=1 Tax=Thunnus albacares TaxID=8236 RepID=UPI001CF65FE4|nr:moesin-like [Thunnus albacares]